MILHELYDDKGIIEFVQKEKYQLNNNIFSPNNAISIMCQIFKMNKLDVEYTYFMGIDFTNIIQSAVLNSKGDKNQNNVNIHNLIIYLAFIKPSKFAMFHNHPNNLVYESQNDIVTEKYLQDVAKNMNIDYLGDYIIGEQTYTKVGDSKEYEIVL